MNTKRFFNWCLPYAFAVAMMLGVLALLGAVNPVKRSDGTDIWDVGQMTNSAGSTIQVGGGVTIGGPGVGLLLTNNGVALASPGSALLTVGADINSGMTGHLVDFRATNGLLVWIAKDGPAYFPSSISGSASCYIGSSYFYAVSSRAGFGSAATNIIDFWAYNAGLYRTPGGVLANTVCGQSFATNGFVAGVMTSNVFEATYTNLVLDFDKASKLTVWATNGCYLTNFLNLEAGQGTVQKEVEVWFYSYAGTNVNMVLPASGNANGYSMRWLGGVAPWTIYTNSGTYMVRFSARGTNIVGRQEWAN